MIVAFEQGDRGMLDWHQLDLLAALGELQCRERLLEVAVVRAQSRQEHDS